MNAEFNHRVYLHPMIAETQREFWVAVTALQMMQAYHGNPYFSFKCVSRRQERAWRAIAELVAPPVYITSSEAHARG